MTERADFAIVAWLRRLKAIPQIINQQADFAKVAIATTAESSINNLVPALPG